MEDEKEARGLSDYYNSILIAETQLRQRRLTEKKVIKKSDRLTKAGWLLIILGVAVSITYLAVGNYLDATLGVGFIGFGTAVIDR